MTAAEIDDFEHVYARWSEYHAVVFGWVRREGGKTAICEAAAALFLTWEPWFFKLAPIEQELRDATEFLAMEPTSFDCKWERHYAMVRSQIVANRRRYRGRNDDPLKDVPHMSVHQTRFIDSLKIGKPET